MTPTPATKRRTGNDDMAMIGDKDDNWPTCPPAQVLEKSCNWKVLRLLPIGAMIADDDE